MRPRACAILPLAMIAFLTAFAVPANSVSGITCGASPPNHCYGLSELDVSPPCGFTGVTAHLRTVCQSVPYPQTEFTTNEVWISNASEPQFWVEVGIYTGAGSASVSTPHFYWAEQRISDGLYYEFDHGPYTASSDTQVAIIESGNQNSYVYYDGTMSQSTGAFDYPATTLQVGTESDSNYVESYGSGFDLAWFDLSGLIHSDWTTASSQAFIRQIPMGGPVYAYGVNGQPWNWMRSGEGSTSC
jgi:hypothetical protein